jgi:RecB family exonuclease
LHAALADLHRSESLPATPEAITSLLRKHWQVTGYANRQQAEEQFELGVRALLNYVQHWGVPFGRILGLECFLARVVKSGGLQFELACRADRIESHPDGSLEILDYKSNADGRLPAADFLAADLATFVYYLLARLTYAPTSHILVSQLNLMSLSKVQVDYSDAQRAENKARLLNLVRAIEAGSLEARPGPHCSWCPVRDQCPHGQVVDFESI